MSMFSEYLQKLIQSRKISISALSRDSGVERTVIHKALTDTRVLSYQAVEALSRYLELSLQEEKQLKQYYNLLFEKEWMQRARNIIDQMFQELSHIRFADPVYRKAPEIISVEDFSEGSSIFVGQVNIKYLLQTVLMEESTYPDPEIQLIVPADADVVYESLLWLYRDHRISVKISQILAFDLAERAEEVNLKSLEGFYRLLQICLFSEQKYHPYYYYTGRLTAEYADPFPYFLVTHKRVVCFSADCDKAMLLKEKEQVSFFGGHFHKLLESCRLLLQYSPCLKIEPQDGSAPGDPSDRFVIMSQPCLRKYLNGDPAEQMQTVEGKSGQLHTFFTRSGTERFLKTGRLDYDPPGEVRPLTVQERKRVLELLIRDVEKGNENAGMLNELMFEFPDYLVLAVERSGFCVHTTGRFPLEDGVYSFYIKEPNLIRIIYDWAKNLPQGNYLYDTEKTAILLREAADIYGCDNIF